MSEEKCCKNCKELDEEDHCQLLENSSEEISSDGEWFSHQPMIFEPETHCCRFAYDDWENFRRG